MQTQGANKYYHNFIPFLFRAGALTLHLIDGSRQPHPQKNKLIVHKEEMVFSQVLCSILGL